MEYPNRVHWAVKGNREEVCKKISDAAKVRWPSKLRKYGITEEQYRSEIAAGNKWCTGHKAFHPVGEFGQRGRAVNCKEYIRTASAERYASLTPEIKSAIAKNQYDRLETPLRMRKRMLWHYYKRTPEQYEAQLAEQGGVCALCGGPPSRTWFCFDHDHACCHGKRSCGKCIRALLCTTCNRRMGLIEHNQAWVKKVETYLIKWGAWIDPSVGPPVDTVPVRKPRRDRKPKVAEPTLFDPIIADEPEVA